MRLSATDEIDYLNRITGTQNSRRPISLGHDLVVDFDRHAARPQLETLDKGNETGVAANDVRFAVELDFKARVRRH